MPTKTKNKPRQLDETTAACVIAEYLAITQVKTAEIERVSQHGGSLSCREIALTFRVSEVLGIPDAFAMPRRFQLAFARAREYMMIHQLATKDQAAEVGS